MRTGVVAQDPACIWEVVKREGNAFWIKSTKNNALMTTVSSSDAIAPFVIKTTSVMTYDDKSKCELIDNKYIKAYGPSFWNWFSPYSIRTAATKLVNNAWSYATKDDADAFTIAKAPEAYVPSTDATVVFHPYISPYNVFTFSDTWKTKTQGHIEAIFSVKAKQDAVIVLSDEKERIDGENNVRTITIGANNNTSIIVHRGDIDAA